MGLPVPVTDIGVRAKGEVGVVRYQEEGVPICMISIFMTTLICHA